jgi:parallel beta-helix repeat protein
MLLLAFDNRLTIRANPETILYVDPSTVMVHIGDSFSINVSVQNVLDLYAFHLFLGYNTTVLDALSVYIYPPFNSGPIPLPIIDDVNGYVEVSGSMGIPGPGFSGSFPLAKITFNATTLGNSELHLCNTDLWDSMSNTIPHATSDGSVTVYSRIIKVPDDYPTIQEAVNAASPGDIIYVYGPDYYPEAVIVNKSVSLIGKFGPGLIGFDVVSNYVYIKGFYFSSEWHFPYGPGIVLNGVGGCEISSVVVSVDEGSGIVLTNASDNVIANSWVGGLIWGGGIVLEKSYNNTIFGNIIEADYGPCIYLDDSSGNKFFHNQFSVYEARPVEVIGDCINVWDDGYPSGGNYWSDYKGADNLFGPYQNLTGSDGIGDTSYTIDENNADTYPLISPYEYWSNPIPGDVNKDMKVSMSDIIQLCDGFGSAKGIDGYFRHKPLCINCPHSPNLDINNDGKISMDEIVIACTNFGKHYP